MRGGGGQQQTPNPTLDLFLIIGFFAVLVAAIWWNFHTQIVEKVYAFRVIEASFFYELLSYLDQVLSPYGFHITADDRILVLIKNMEYSVPSQVGYKTFFATLNQFGRYMIIPTVAMSVFFSCMLMFFHKGSKYKQVYTMDTFSDLELVNNPEIGPVVGKKLIKQGLDEGPWAMSIQPMDFAKKYDLIVEKVNADGTKKAVLKRGRAHDVFALQLGPRWSGSFDGCPGYVMALFAIFAAKSQHDSKGAKALIQQIAKSSKSGKLDFGGTRDLLIKHVKAPAIGRVVGPHAYILTMMASMLDLARTDGVLASAEFLWLKPVDRRMWYMLNAVGRPTAFPEVAGPFAHWIVEKRLRRPLKIAMVEEAVEALDSALADIVFDVGDK
ncbi:MAG TPA: type IVB secretion system coupling complex protein DotM/IcmP [Gammaproteobacteria bacterium]|nr:type IVB secretion system coupling complex protein DotM/IcmP [Gammaproteobacteria bacterium]